MTKQRLFVAQIVTAIEEQWFAPCTATVIRTERSYGVEPRLFAAADENDAYRIVQGWLEKDAFSDANHDGAGDRTEYFAVGIHELEEVPMLDEIPAAVRELYGVDLPGFNLLDADSNGVPVVREKEQLEVFRLLRLTTGSPDR